MKLRLTRLATCIDKYGLSSGILLYARLKTNRVTRFRVPGISSHLFLRKASSDLAIFEQVFLFNEYDIPLGFTPQIIVDAGANVGLFAVFMKNRYPQSTIIAIEPDAGNFEVLKKNTVTYRDVHLIQAGLWHSASKLEIVDKFHQGYSALAVKESMQGSVRAISIDEVMTENSLPYIDLLKIDIESSEQQVFLKNTDQWLRKVRTIVIELHDDFEPGCARVFFDTVTKTFGHYRYTICGENTIIENLDFSKD
jgi:FkbM family methyltransferase